MSTPEKYPKNATADTGMVMAPTLALTGMRILIEVAEILTVGDDKEAKIKLLSSVLAGDADQQALHYLHFNATGVYCQKEDFDNEAVITLQDVKERIQKFLNQRKV